MHQRVSIFASCLEMFLIKYSDEEAQPGPARRQSLQGMLETGKNEGTQDEARSTMGVSTTCSRADVGVALTHLLWRPTVHHTHPSCTPA